MPYINMGVKLAYIKISGGLMTPQYFQNYNFVGVYSKSVTT